MVFSFPPIDKMRLSGIAFKVRGRLFFPAKSGSMNCVEAPLSIMAEPIVPLFKRTGTIIGSLHPRSAKLIPVDPNPLDPRPVFGSSSTRVHSGLSMHSRMSCDMRSQILICKGVSELLMGGTLICPV